MRPSRSIHTVVNGKIFFFSANVWRTSHCVVYIFISFSLFIHPSVNTKLFPCHCSEYEGADICLFVFCSYLFKLMLSFSSDKYWCGIAETYGSSIFNFLRNLCITSHSDCTYLHSCSHQQCMGIPFPPHPYRHLLFLVFLILDSLASVRWYLTVVLICISLMTGDIEHIFRYLLAIYMSLVKRL